MLSQPFRLIVKLVTTVRNDYVTLMEKLVTTFRIDGKLVTAIRVDEETSQNHYG